MNSSRTDPQPVLVSDTSSLPFSRIHREDHAPQQRPLPISGPFDVRALRSRFHVASAYSGGPSVATAEGIRGCASFPAEDGSHVPPTRITWMSPRKRMPSQRYAVQLLMNWALPDPPSPRLRRVRPVIDGNSAKPRRSKMGVTGLPNAGTHRGRALENTCTRAITPFVSGVSAPGRPKPAGRSCKARGFRRTLPRGSGSRTGRRFRSWPGTPRFR